MSFSSFSHAGFIETSWKTIGDNKATLHEETGIEWLDLTQTDGESLAYVLDNLDGKYAGWRLPTKAEVETMFSAFFSDVDLSASRINSIYSGSFVSLFGKTATNVIAKENYTNGIYFDNNGDAYGASAYARTIINASYQNVISAEKLSGNDSYGYFLVSDGGVTISSIENPSLNAKNANSPSNVPEPLGLAAFLIGGLAFARRKKI